MTPRRMTPVSDQVLHALSTLRAELPAALTGEQVRALHAYTDTVYDNAYAAGYLRAHMESFQQAEADRRAQSDQAVAVVCRTAPTDPPTLATLNVLPAGEFLELAALATGFAVGSMDMPARLAELVGLELPSTEFRPPSVAGVDTVFDQSLAPNEVRTLSLVFRVYSDGLLRRVLPAQS